MPGVITWIICVVTIVIAIAFATLAEYEQNDYLGTEGVGDYPYIIVVCQKLVHGSVEICGGTLIQPEWVLTSEKCRHKDYKNNYNFAVASVFNLENLMNSPIRQITAWISHPEYDKDKYSVTNDLAILHLESSFIINQNMEQIFLPPKSILNNEELQTKFERCIFIFWGITTTNSVLKPRMTWLGNETNSTHLQVITVRPMLRTKCEELYNHQVILTHGQLCGSVEGKYGIPTNHTGGPLVCHGFQFGVYSWQHMDTLGRILPIFTRVDKFEKYITSVVPNLKLAADSNFWNISRRNTGEDMEKVIRSQAVLLRRTLLLNLVYILLIILWSSIIL